MDLNELSKNPEQIKSLITLLQSLLPEKAEQEQHNVVDDQFNNPNIKTKNIKNRTKQDASSNKFLSMPERNMHKEDTAIDKVLCQAPPVARGREFTPVKVRCRVCNKEELVNPAIVYDLRENRYKCNKCSSSAG